MFFFYELFKKYTNIFETAQIKTRITEELQPNV
jgi:hypothetical protein